MSVGEYVAFASALFVMVITPGPGVLACVSRGLSSGYRKAIFVVLGIITGDLIFVSMALFGLSAIAELMGGFFTVVRYLGAAYLIWLGCRTWTSKVNTNQPHHQKDSSPTACYLGGLSLTLGNPKAIVFYLSILPAFLDLKRIAALDIAITLTIVLFTLTTVLLTYSVIAARFGMIYKSSRALRNISRCSGSAMIAAGVGIAIKE